MLYEFKTKLTTGQIVAQAKAFFGKAPDGLGLELTTEDDCCLTFVGGGGRVSLSAAAEGKNTVVSIETTEWDRQVKEFLKAHAK